MREHDHIGVEEGQAARFPKREFLFANKTETNTGGRVPLD